jgi:hypothetical protein
MFNIKVFSYRQLDWQEQKRINDFLETIGEGLKDIKFTHDDMFHNCVIIYDKDYMHI